MSRPSWQDFAACKDMDPAVFFPHYPQGKSSAPVKAAIRAIDKQAKAVCATCPVLEQCREWAFDQPEYFGTWGGTTEKEREAIRKQTRPSCGTHNGYKRHWRNHEEPCGPCNTANNIHSNEAKARMRLRKAAA